MHFCGVKFLTNIMSGIITLYWPCIFKYMSVPTFTDPVASTNKYQPAMPYIDPVYCTPGIDAPSRGEPSPLGRGGSPPFPHAVGSGGFPAPPQSRKNDQNRGEVAGEIKARISTFLNRGNMMIILMVMLIAITIKIMNVEYINFT